MTVWVVLLVIVACLGGAIWLLRDLAAQRAEWDDHARQVEQMRQWELSHVGGPYDQDDSGPPELRSPYAVPSGDPNAPQLPPRPGAGHYLWAAILVVVAGIVLLAYLAPGAAG